jgi:hypothetical protein
MLMDSVVFDQCRGPGTVAQVVCSRSRASIGRSSERQNTHTHTHIHTHTQEDKIKLE